tara:strand:- start:969 stop:1493 length:525 start_codon:yes stop_codon:yes gene_type:complete
MKKKFNTEFSLLTFCFIPLLFFWNPSFITLMGVQPHWAMFWLFPWSSLYGSFYGFLTGLSLGIVLDSLNYDMYTQIPGLVICGFLFGKLDKYKSNELNRFQYGLICAIGSLFCNVLYFCQYILHQLAQNNIVLLSHGIKNTVAQVFITALLAPVICNWLFYLFKKNNFLGPPNF